MIVSDLVIAKKKLPGVIKDPKGEKDLDVWYSEDALTPDALDRAKSFENEKTDGHLAVCEMLVGFGMEWNLERPGKDGQLEPVPTNMETLKGISIKALVTVLEAITEDVNPKATNSPPSETGSSTETSSTPSLPTGP